MRLLVILLLFTSCTLLGQQNHKQIHVSDSVNQLIEYYLLPKKNGHRYYKDSMFYSKASLSELHFLTRHPSPEIRCLAFRELIKSDCEKDSIFQILLEHLSDTVERVYSSLPDPQKNSYDKDDEGNSIMTLTAATYQTVADYFLTWACPKYKFPPTGKKILSKEQQCYIDSIVLPNPIYSFRYAAFRNYNFTDKYYELLHRLNMYKEHHFPLYNLAMFHKEEDIEIIKNHPNAYSRYRAISYFPHPAFMPIIEDGLDKFLKRKTQHVSDEALFRAIGAYHDTTACKLLQKALKEDSDKEYVIKLLNEEVISLMDPNVIILYEPDSDFMELVYIDLYWDLIQQRYINYSILELLILTDQDKAVRYFIEVAQDLSLLQDQNMNYRSILSGRDLRLMLDLILKKDRGAWINIMNSNIPIIEGIFEEEFFMMLGEIKPKESVKPMLKRLSRDSEGLTKSYIVAALVQYDNDAINKKMVKILMKNKESTNDYSWIQIVEILNNYGIRIQ